MDQTPGAVNDPTVVKTFGPIDSEQFEAAIAAPALKSKADFLNVAIDTVASRGEAYDGAEDNFDRIARYWHAHLVNAYGDIVPPISATDVALMMALMKIARLDFNPTHEDSYVDLAGYAACGGEIAANQR